MILDDDDSPPNPLKAFDAFPKVHKSYVHKGSSRGGIVTVVLLVSVVLLAWTETWAWWQGEEVMRASVESGIGHGMQINVDITVAMHCDGTQGDRCLQADAVDVEVNVLDATGDRILAGEELTKEPVSRPATWLS